MPSMNMPKPVDPFFRDAKQYFPVSQYRFSRAGAFLALAIDNVKYGRGTLTLTTCHGKRTHGQSSEGARLYRIFATYNGERVPFATQQTGPAELVLHTRHGDIRFTWATYNRLMAEGDPGMGLEWTRDASMYETVRPRKDGAWESIPQRSNPMCFKGLEGSGFTFKDTWDWHAFSATSIVGYTTPAPDGTFTLAVEEFPYMVKVPNDYVTYAEAKADMLKSWEEFWAAYPKLIEPYAQKAEETAYNLWTMLVGPTDLTPRWMIQMFPGVIVSQWQLVQNAVALQDIPDLARDLLMAPLERQGETGQLADDYDEAHWATGGIKPPIYGWALKNIMARHDLLKEWPREDLEKLYVGAGRWAMWFMECRDDDNDGLPGFDNGAGTGFDEITAYLENGPMATPDLCAYEVLNFEAQGDLAKLLGKPQEEIDGWYKMSKDLLDRMVDKMWIDGHFVCLKQYTHEPVFSTCNIHYIPLILGSRLPQDVLDKLTADLMREDHLLTPYGIASEDIQTDYFEMIGTRMGSGAISPPGEIFILTGLWEGGKKEEAKLIIDRYLGALMQKGFPHYLDPISGDGTFPGGTWCRNCFTTLARMVSEG